jgi:L-fuconolactonase
MRIDAHQHFWRYTPQSHAWIDDAMAALKRDFLPADLAPLLRDAGFDGSIAVQAEQTPEETAWLLSLAEAHPFIRGVVGWTDLRSPAVEAQLGALAAHPKLRGVRHVLQDEPDDRFMLQPEFVRGVRALAPFGLTYDILIYPHQMAAAFELTQMLPDQPFVIDHIAKPRIRDREIDGWSRGMAALARGRNVYCKLSGLVTEADWATWTVDDLRPYMDVIFDWFPPERVMIGSDWPVCTLAGPYARVVEAARAYLDRLPRQARDAVMGETAARFYGLASDA